MLHAEQTSGGQFFLAADNNLRQRVGILNGSVTRMERQDSVYLMVGHQKTEKIVTRATVIALASPLHRPLKAQVQQVHLLQEVVQVALELFNPGLRHCHLSSAGSWDPMDRHAHSAHFPNPGAPL